MDATSLVTQQIPIGLILVFVQNWLKQQKWFPFINYSTARANHIVSIITTGLATLGVHFSYSSVDHSLLITGLAWSTVFAGAWHWLQQYAITKGLYTGLAPQLNPPSAQAVQPVVVAEDTVVIKKDDPYSIK